MGEPRRAPFRGTPPAASRSTTRTSRRPPRLCGETNVMISRPVQPFARRMEAILGSYAPELLARPRPQGTTAEAQRTWEKHMRELTERIIGAAIEVHKGARPGIARVDLRGVLRARDAAERADFRTPGPAPGRV